MPFSQGRNAGDAEGDPALAWSERALAAIDELGCDEIRPYVLVNLGTVLCSTEDREDEGIAMLHDAWQQALARNDSITIGRALNNLLRETSLRGG